MIDEISVLYHYAINDRCFTSIRSAKPKGRGSGPLKLAIADIGNRHQHMPIYISEGPRANVITICDLISAVESGSR